MGAVAQQRDHPTANGAQARVEGGPGTLASPCLAAVRLAGILRATQPLGCILNACDCSNRLTCFCTHFQLAARHIDTEAPIRGPGLASGEDGGGRQWQLLWLPGGMELLTVCAAVHPAPILLAVWRCTDHMTNHSALRSLFHHAGPSAMLPCQPSQVIRPDDVQLLRFLGSGG